jgi:UDP-N-acetylglucosamine acyltransferase
MTGGHIAHDCRIGDRVVMANCTHLGGFTEVEAGAVFSGNISVTRKCASAAVP